MYFTKIKAINGLYAYDAQGNRLIITGKAPIFPGQTVATDGKIIMNGMTNSGGGVISPFATGMLILDFDSDHNTHVSYLDRRGKVHYCFSFKDNGTYCYAYEGATNIYVRITGADKTDDGYVYPLLGKNKLKRIRHPYNDATIVDVEGDILSLIAGTGSINQDKTESTTKTKLEGFMAFDSGQEDNPDRTENPKGDEEFYYPACTYENFGEVSVDESYGWKASNQNGFGWSLWQNDAVLKSCNLKGDFYSMANNTMMLCSSLSTESYGWADAVGARASYNDFTVSVKSKNIFYVHMSMSASAEGITISEDGAFICEVSVDFGQSIVVLNGNTNMSAMKQRASIRPLNDYNMSLGKGHEDNPGQYSPFGGGTKGYRWSEKVRIIKAWHTPGESKKDIKKEYKDAEITYKIDDKTYSCTGVAYVNVERGEKEEVEKDCEQGYQDIYARVRVKDDIELDGYGSVKDDIELGGYGSDIYIYDGEVHAYVYFSMFFGEKRNYKGDKDTLERAEEFDKYEEYIFVNYHANGCTFQPSALWLEDRYKIEDGVAARSALLAHNDNIAKTSMQSLNSYWYQNIPGSSITGRDYKGFQTCDIELDGGTLWKIPFGKSGGTKVTFAAVNDVYYDNNGDNSNLFCNGHIGWNDRHQIFNTTENKVYGYDTYHVNTMYFTKGVNIAINNLKRLLKNKGFEIYHKNPYQNNQE